jgi:predicted nuclease of predicted toxin-antitoxin system
MILWLDAQLPPSLAPWIVATFSIKAIAIRDVGLRAAKDVAIFQAAREAGAVVMTKDADFVELVRRRGVPPPVLWVTCGNTSNARLQQILLKCLPAALAQVERGEPVLEITDRPSAV